MLFRESVPSEHSDPEKRSNAIRLIIEGKSESEEVAPQRPGNLNCIVLHQTAGMDTWEIQAWLLIVSDFQARLSAARYGILSAKSTSHRASSVSACTVWHTKLIAALASFLQYLLQHKNVLTIAVMKHVKP